MKNKIFRTPLTKSIGSSMMSDKINPMTFAGKASLASLPPFRSDKLILLTIKSYLTW